MNLRHIGLLRLAGPDAVSFLQGQVSNDTRALSSGAPILAAYSTPQGRVAAVLHLLPHSSGVIALLPREIVLPTLERLRKFVMRAKVTLEDVSEEFSVRGCRGSQALSAAGLTGPIAPGYLEEGGIGVSRVAPAAERYWVIGTQAHLASRLGTVREGAAGEDATHGADAQRTEGDWRLADIRDGLPQIYAATREMFVAQMLNLDLVGGISFNKGCYTGQEIIARTQHLGRIKRRLYRLRLPAGSWAIGQALRLADGRNGRLTELAQADEGWEALAVLNVSATDTVAETAQNDSSEANGGEAVDARELPLPYSVAPSA